MKAVWRVGLAAVLYAGALGALHGWEGRRSSAEYLAAPPAGTARVLGAGFDNMLADGLYLQFVNYFGKHLRRDQSYHNMVPALEVITSLDPQFPAPYRLGALALGDARLMPELEAFLEKRLKRFPGDWNAAYDAGMTMFIFAEKPDEYMRAAEFFRQAAAMPGADPKASYMQARAYHAVDRRDLVVTLWRRLYASAPTPEARLVAKRSLARLGETPTPPHK